MTKYERLISKIDSYNKGSYYKIKLKPINSGQSLFLEIRRDGMRKKHYLKLHISCNTVPTREDKEAVEKAREKQLYYDELYKKQELETLSTLDKKKQNALRFFESRRDAHEKASTRKIWNNTINHFREFAGDKITFQQIDFEFCQEFRKYLLTKVKPYTTNTYFSIFKRMLNAATEKGVFIVSPAHQVKNPKPEAKRDFLTLEELKTLKDTKLIDGHGNHKIQIERAFFFACFTGLRLTDVINLKWTNIINDDHLRFKIKKTDRILKIKLPDTAREIIELQKEDYPENENIFILPASGVIINKHLKRWSMLAGIEKHITFHVARHTAACLSIKFGNSLLATSKILGHSTTKTTEIYAKILDEDKDKAMDNFPKL